MDSNHDAERLELEPPILQGLGQAVPQVDPPAELRARILRSVGARSTVLPMPMRRETSAAWASWLPAAAALALAAGMTVYAVQLRGRVTALETELREARSLAAAAELQVADARRVATGAQSAVAVLTAPDVVRVDLAGQAVAPDARARAFWSRPRGMVFTASNLPALPPGRTYQLWVITSDPAPLSAGLLTPDAQGGVSEVIATPANIPQPVAMAVTIEPSGGVPAPTGEKYLVGLLSGV